MPVIAMTREMGTCGKGIALGVADALNLEVVHHEIVERAVAQRLGKSESSVHRFLEGQASLWERWRIDSKRLSRFTSEEILELALKGNVIIRGWGAAQLLQKVPGITCVRVCAPMQFRIAEMVRRLGVEDEAFVRREIERNDAAHERLVRSKFGTVWHDSTGYDIVINTGRVSVEHGVPILCDLAKAIEDAASADTNSILEDELIKVRVHAAIDESRYSDEVGIHLEISVSSRKVRVEGVIENNTDTEKIIELIKDVQGVIDVDADLRALTMSYPVYSP